MDEEKYTQPFLDFDGAEINFLERLRTLGSLVKVLNANGIQANVLRWIYEEGGCHRDVDLDLARIGGTPWVQASANTVRKALLFWESAGIIEIERDRRDARRQASNAARLRWRFVRQRLYGEGRSDAPSPPSPAGHREAEDGHGDQRFSSASNSDRLKLSASNSELSASNSELSASNSELSASKNDALFWRLKPSASNSDRLTMPDLRNPIRVCACVRTIRLLSSVCTVVDDVRRERRAEVAEIWALAEEARRPMYPVHWPRDPQVRATFVQAAVLAAMVFSEPWLLAATRATKAKPAASWRYWIGCLRNGLTEIEGLQQFASVEELRSYFATLMQAVASIAQAVVEQCGDKPPPANEPASVPAPDDPPLTREEFREIRQRIRAEAAGTGEPVAHLPPSAFRPPP